MAIFLRHRIVDVQNSKKSILIDSKASISTEGTASFGFLHLIRAPSFKARDSHAPIRGRGGDLVVKKGLGPHRGKSGICSPISNGWNASINTS